MTTETSARVIKVDKSNLMDLKGACDDALRESHRHTDTKLAFGYLGCVFAAAGSYYGYIHPFEEPDTKFWTFISVGLYFFFNALMMGYAQFVEKNTVFLGSKTTSEGTQTISVGTGVRNYDPFYIINIDMTQPPRKSSGSVAPKPKKATHQEYSTAFRFWFDEDGVLARDLFEADLKKFLANTEATHLD
ncbi:hypothetical protein BGW38_009038 [Lunasporangiospora selenospora]|uniref:Signal peptidase complex subunit 2 n=1 Tax=Lunasporangiospora selenospora TaxID=979761 RepID=A0A9P6FXM9_9FUNG|nr:hypothetical protein BGW38_009038 [Lunasporangiospora selenospora]